jgi:hypothetical protein
VVNDMRKRWILAVAAIAFLVPGCVYVTPVLWAEVNAWGFTPENAAQKESAFCEDATQLKTHYRAPNLAVVACYGKPDHLKAGYVVVARLPWGMWSSSNEGSGFNYDRNPNPALRSLIECSSSGPTQSTVYVSPILMGRTLSPSIVAIEAKLNNGQTLRDTVQQGLFVLEAQFQRVGVDVEEVRILGENDRLLHQVKFDPKRQKKVC